MTRRVEVITTSLPQLQRIELPHALEVELDRDGEHDDHIAGGEEQPEDNVIEVLKSLS